VRILLKIKKVKLETIDLCPISLRGFTRVECCRYFLRVRVEEPVSIEIHAREVNFASNPLSRSTNSIVLYVGHGTLHSNADDILFETRNRRSLYCTRGVGFIMFSFALSLLGGTLQEEPGGCAEKICLIYNLVK